MNTFKKSLLVGLVASTVSPIILAEPTQLDTVVVSATRSEQTNASIPGSITVITSEQIENSGATNIAQVLRGQGGIQVRDLIGDGTGITVGMRGFGATAGSNTLLLVDGRRLNNPDLGAPEFSNIHLKDIERIEIIQGSAGALFGDQAVGGVINIITKRPDGFHVYAKVTTGSYDNNSFSIGVSNKLDNGFSYRFSAVTRDADNFRDRNEIEYENLFGRVDYNFGSGNVFFEYQNINENIFRPGGLFTAAFALDRRAARFLTDFNNTDTANTRIGVSYALSDNWQLEAEFTDRDTDVLGRLSGFNLVQNREVEEFTPRLIGSFDTQHGETLVTIGADFIDSDYSLTAFGTTTNQQEVSNFYAQVVYPITSKITGTIGARSARVENNLVDAFKFTNGIEIDDSQTVYELGLSVSISPQWRAFIRRDENFRFAKLDEHTSTLGGVVALDTQTGISYEVGTEWQRGNNRAKATLFQLRLKNEIDYDTVNFANVNLDPTVRNGLIIEGSWQVNKAMTVSGQYTYIDAKFDEGSFDGNKVPFVAKNTASINVNYKLNSNWRVFAEAQYISDRFAAGDLSNGFDELDGYTILNTNLTYTRKNWLAALRINNITDRKYSDFAATSYNIATFTNDIAFYAAPERNVTLSIQYSY